MLAICAVLLAAVGVGVGAGLALVVAELVREA
jgi:small-conductance mechanosensitive channel